MTLKPTYEALEKRVANLEESEKKYRQLFETALVGMYRTRIKDGKLLDANESLSQMMGYESVDIFLNEFVTSEQYAEPKHREALIKLLNTNGTVDGFEIEMIKRDGTRIYIAISAIIYPEHGYIEGVIVDITGKKEAQKGLIEAYEIIKRSPAVAFLWQNAENWPVEYVSENVDVLFGYTAGDFISDKVVYSEIIHHDDLERVTQEVVNFSAEKSRDRFAHEPYRIVTKEGEIKWISDRTFIRRNEQGEITHYHGIVIDITKRKLAENNLILERDRLHEALAEIKALSGLLPICASCKKIRDDNGYWNQIEEYIRDHSEAEFSHGICPDCIKELYPDFKPND